MLRYNRQVAANFRKTTRALLYIGVIAIYYINNPILNILNLILATVAALVLNKDIVTKSLTLIKSRF